MGWAVPFAVQCEAHDACFCGLGRDFQSTFSLVRYRVLGFLETIKW